jgi:5-formyltetrahydrofolate cyclo-ligase
MTKKEARIKYSTLRNQLTDDEVEVNSLAIANQLLKMNIWDNTYFHLFLAIKEKKEVETEYILQILQGKDKEVVVSKSNFDTREMTHYLLTDATKFQKNEYHIYEPVDGIEVPSKKIDVVFIPLLGYDKKGNRVGYGKGFYDIFLAKCKPDILKIGLSFYEPEENIEDVLATDIHLDYCVTTQNVHLFR